MNKVITIIIFSILSLVGDTQSPDITTEIELTEPQLILGLSNMDPIYREKCAEQIRYLLTNQLNTLAKGNIAENLNSYWTKKINDNKVKMKKEEFELEFFDSPIDYEPNYDDIKFYQLDHFHLLRTRIGKKKVEIIHLSINPLSFNIKPNLDYTGIWKTYYITGLVHTEAVYLNGKRNGIEIIYNWNGDKSWLKHYEDGEAKDIYSFRNGKMVKEELEILDIEEEEK